MSSHVPRADDRLSVLGQVPLFPTSWTESSLRVSRRTRVEFSSRLVSTETRTWLMKGFQSKELIIKAGLVLGDVDQYPYLDVTIDGADE